MKPDEEPPSEVKSTLEAMNRHESVGSGSMLRVSFFLAVVITTLALSIPLWGGYAIGAAMSAGSGGAGPALVLIPLADLAIIAISGIIIFRKKK